MNNKSEAKDLNNFIKKLDYFSEKSDFNFASENNNEINKGKFNTNNSTNFEKKNINDIVIDCEIYRNNYSYNFRQKYENLKSEHQVLQNKSYNLEQKYVKMEDFEIKDCQIFNNNCSSNLIKLEKIDCQLFKNKSYNFFTESENFSIINNQIFNKNFSENDTSNIEIEIDECKVEKNIQIEYYNNLDFYISNNCNNFYLNDNS